MLSILSFIGITDTLAQTGVGIGTSTPQEKLDVTGAIKIGTTSTTNPGTIRWDGNNFQGYNGSIWVNLDAAGGADADWTASGINQYSGVSGNVGVGTNSPSAKLEVAGTFESGSSNTASGANSVAIGNSNTASGIASFAGGTGSTASGDYSRASGISVTASVYGSTAFGDNANASGFNSTAIGWGSTSSGHTSVALGAGNAAGGDFSAALGSNLISPSAHEVVVGRYNTDYTPNSISAWDANDRIFVVGNGASVGTKSNALTIYKSGKMNINDAYDMPLADGSSGQVLTTNGSGAAAWQALPTISGPTGPAGPQGPTGPLVAGSTKQTLRHDGAGWVASSTLVNDGTNVGIGTATPTATLEVVGTFESGNDNDASGTYSAATGQNNTASGYTSFASGLNNTASGNYATATGANNTAIGESSFASGLDNTAFGNYAAATGDDNTASGEASFASGSGNTASGDNSAATGHITIASGESSFASGVDNTASGPFAVATGESSLASGEGSFTSGSGNTASGNNSVATGRSNTASGFASFTSGRGNTASGILSAALGNFNQALGTASFATGNRTVARSAYETVMGQYNTAYTPGSPINWNSNDRLFVIGNGTDPTALSDAMVVLKNGNTGIGTSTPARTLHVTQAMRLEPSATAPANPSAGDMYFSSATTKLMVYDGTTWQACW